MLPTIQALLSETIITMDGIVEITEYPLNKCLTTNMVYKAVVSAPSKPDKKYFGIAETTFKERFRTTQEISVTKVR